MSIEQLGQQHQRDRWLYLPGFGSSASFLRTVVMNSGSTVVALIFLLNTRIAVLTRFNSPTPGMDSPHAGRDNQCFVFAGVRHAAGVLHQLSAPTGWTFHVIAP
ncbi:hypothetical protein [Pseudomonas sp. MPFS]|uniref:hypothetical protein n=1 Tax=Pseudomonas sp. MPFS TaxID=2795724 RepID=UPI003217C7B0